MFLLPYENLLLKTNLSIEEQRSRLKKIVGKRRLFSFIPDLRFDYAGTIENNEFKISRNIGYKNSFKPIIIGKLMDTGYQRTYIHLIMRPNLIVAVFLLFWFGGAFFILFGTLISSSPKFTVFSIEIYPYVLPLLFIMFGYGILIFGFKIESNRSKKDLIKLFDAYQVEEIKLTNHMNSP